MPDPYGWDAQKRQIQINQQAANERNQEEIHAGAVAFNQRQAAERQPQRDSGPAQPAAASTKQAPYWAVVAHCPVHNKWGCAYKQKEARRAYYEAMSAASGHGSDWCKLESIKTTAGLVFAPGYLMVRRNRAGKYGWDTGRYVWRIERKIRRRLGPDSELMLLVSVRDGVLVNNGLDLQVGWGREMPGALM